METTIWKRRNAGPFNWHRPYRASDDLRVNAFVGESRQNLIQLAVAHERLAANDRDVNGTMLLDQLEESRDELVALVIADLSQRDAAAEVVVTVRVTAGAAQGTFPSDLNRERGPDTRAEFFPTT